MLQAAPHTSQTLTATNRAPYRKPPTQVSVSIQTDFRETAIETDPWTAPYDKQLENAHVELTSLIQLTFNNMLLPAHEKTLDVIQQIEDERNFEAQIPPPLDLMRADFSEKELQQQEKRVQMEIEKEKRKWDKIEQEMARNDQLRLEELVDKLEIRAQARDEIRGVELNRISQRFENQLAADNEKLNNQAISMLKRSTRAYRQNIEHVASMAGNRTISDRLVIQTGAEPRLALPEQHLTRNAVKNAVHSANPLNAPILKPGEAPYRFAGVIRLAGTELKTEQDFDEILQYIDESEDRLASEFAEPKKYNAGKRSYAVSSDNPLPKILPTPAAALQLSHKRKIQQQIEKQLEREGGRILEAEENQAAKQENFFYEEPPSTDQLRESDAALYIENLIRGFATEMKLEAGKGRRIGLVSELRLAHELVRNQDNAGQEEARLSLLRDSLAAGGVANAAAAVIGESLDAICKNRERQSQVFRARALLEIALRERSRREQLESQLRQKENMQRSRSDYELTQEVKTHRELVDAFVLRAQKKAVDKDAAERAKQLALQEVEALVELDYETSKKSGGNPEEVLKSVLQDFLLPEVDRRVQAQKQAKDMQKLVLAGNMASTAARIASDHYQKEPKSFVGRLEVDEQKNLGAVIVEDGAQSDNLNDNQFGEQEVQQRLSKIEEKCSISIKRWITDEEEEPGESDELK